jgi:hypothetical protein
MISPVVASATTAPTDGFGAVAPRFPSARKSACRMSAAMRSGGSDDTAAAPCAALKGGAGISVIQTLIFDGARKGFTKLPEHALKVSRFAEIPVNAGIADISYTIQSLQSFHDEAADILGADLGVVPVFERAHDGADELFYAVFVHGALPESDFD